MTGEQLIEIVNTEGGSTVTLFDGSAIIAIIPFDNTDDAIIVDKSLVAITANGAEYVIDPARVSHVQVIR